MMCRLYKYVLNMLAATLNYFNAHCVWMVTESGVLCCVATNFYLTLQYNSVIVLFMYC